MVSVTAATVLARNHYGSTDFDPATSSRNETTSYTNVEYIIDDAIDFVNAEAGTSMSTMADTVGSAGSKSITITGAQNAALKLILSVMLKETKYKISTSGSLGPASASESVGSQDQIFRKMFWTSINRLRGRSFVTT